MKTIQSWLGGTTSHPVFRNILKYAIGRPHILHFGGFQVHKAEPSCLSGAVEVLEPDTPEPILLMRAWADLGGKNAMHCSSLLHILACEEHTQLLRIVNISPSSLRVSILGPSLILILAAILIPRSFAILFLKVQRHNGSRSISTRKGFWRRVLRTSSPSPRILVT